MPIELHQVLDAERSVQIALAECESRGAIHVERIDLDRLNFEIAQQEQSLTDRFGASSIRWIWLPILLFFTGRVACGRIVVATGIPLFAVALLVAILGMALGLTIGAVLSLPQPATIVFGAFLCVIAGPSFAAWIIAINEATAKQKCSEILKWKDELNVESAKLQVLHRKKNALAELFKVRASFDALALHAQALRREYESIANQLAMVNWRAMRGVEFEKFLANVFRYHGFTVETTKVTGDQGIDLIASSQSMRLAIQVKGYESSVGNDAVQQAHAGKSHYKCTHSLVITNSVFTRSAQALAKSVECRLIDEIQIPDLIAGRIFLAFAVCEDSSLQTVDEGLINGR